MGKPDCTHPKMKKLGAGRIKLFVDLRKKLILSTDHLSSFGSSCQDLFHLNPKNLFNFYDEFEVKIKKKKKKKKDEAHRFLNHTRATGFPPLIQCLNSFELEDQAVPT